MFLFVIFYVKKYVRKTPNIYIIHGKFKVSKYEPNRHCLNTNICANRNK